MMKPIYKLYRFIIKPQSMKNVLIQSVKFSVLLPSERRELKLTSFIRAFNYGNFSSNQNVK